jgi:hypothetical protein
MEAPRPAPEAPRKKEKAMTRRIVALAVILAVLALAAPASALAAQAGKSAASQRGALSGIRTDVSCHDPCDDPFQLKAWVRGSNVGGLMVKFSVKGRTFQARTSGSGYAHYHLRVSPSSYPQGVIVTVKASVSHGGVTKSAATWFKPNYN